MTPSELAQLTVRGDAVGIEIKDSKPYIDVLHEQIGDSLVESEREVAALIEKLNLLSEQSSSQMERITQSVQSGKAMTEVTHDRVERNKQLIFKLEAKLDEHASEIQDHYKQMCMLADDVKGLTPVVKVIASIAHQTTMLALNAEIEATRAGNAGQAFAVIADEVKELSKRSTSAAADIAEKLNVTVNKVAGKMVEAQKIQKKQALDDLEQLVGYLTEMQQDFSKSCESQLDVISDVEAGHQESVNILLDAMGHIQFQDVMRQRMEHVQSALLEMRDHLQMLSTTSSDSAWNGKFDLTFSAMLAGHLNQYRMASQTATHLAVAGGNLQSDYGRPAIELF